MGFTFKWPILLFILVGAMGCSDGNPQVDFLTFPTIQKAIKPGASSSVNLSPTTTATGGVYKLKGRVTYMSLQTAVGGGNYKIKGKISF